TTLLRTTENKLYRQGVADRRELEQGFPAQPEELFGFRGLIVGSVEANYFTPAQQQLIHDFADRRGGGVLFLGGRRALSESGWNRPPVAAMLPVVLPQRTGTFHRDRARVALTQAGRESLICRLVEPAEANAERWRSLPALADYQEAGEPKPGALVLATLETPEGRTLPLLVTQNYGRGRVALFATGGSWRWQMLQPFEDMTHEIFWQQLLRWLVTGAAAEVSGSTPRPVLEDDSQVMLRAEVRDKAFRPVADARVEARLMGPGGSSETIELRPLEEEPGAYEGEWSAREAGAYSAEIIARRGEQELGRDLVLFRREDGVAEDFRSLQNRELLRGLAASTGGRYYRPQEAARLAEEIAYSEAGLSVRETRDLWDMPALLLLALGLRSAEWLLRRRWGAV
ncbi:MAG: glutamine amidotransferase, partial [Bryobacteraceae bacterium]